MKPYFESPDITIFHGDCREVLAGLDAASIGAVVTDPPYGQSNESYDKGVPLEVWQECFRVACPGCALLSFAGNPTYHRIASDIERASWKIKQMWAWVYNSGYMTSAYPKEGYDRLVPAMTPICYASKGKCLLKLERTGPAWSRSRFKPTYSTRCRVCKLSAPGSLPRSLVATDDIRGFESFHISMAHGTNGEQVGSHPNQKPLRLMRWLLEKLPADLILDPYMGSGTTLLAARALGRRAIGIEIEERYAEIAVKRLEKGVQRMLVMT